MAEGRIERTQGGFFSADETADVGVDEATPVTEEYKEGDNAFTGKILKVVVEYEPVELGAADHSQLKSAAQIRKLAE